MADVYRIRNLSGVQCRQACTVEAIQISAVSTWQSAISKTLTPSSSAHLRVLCGEKQGER